MKKTSIVLVLAGFLAGAASPAFAACGHSYRAAAPAKARTVASARPEKKPAQTVKAPDVAQPAPTRDTASVGNATFAEQTAAAPTGGGATAATF